MFAVMCRPHIKICIYRTDKNQASVKGDAAMYHVV